MGDIRKRKVVLEILLVTCVFAALILGVAIGLFVAKSHNVKLGSSMGEYNLATPSQILDRKGRLITEFFGDVKRDIVPLDEMPKHLVYALITREDSRFFQHHGFSVRGFLRAAWKIMTHQYVSGGSTITQQLAGTLYADRTDRTIDRKLKELWWAVQLERNLTKKQILELYMNETFFGSGTHGVEAASLFYFGHSARTMTLAESAMLVIQLANPARYSPFHHPDAAKKLQRLILQKMVGAGFASRDAADRSFDDYWSDYDYTRPAHTSAFSENRSEAPYFSEYVRQELERSLYGKLDYFRDGLVVHTTLDMDYQRAAQRVIQRDVRAINATYRSASDSRFAYVDRQFVPVVSLLALGFDLTAIDEARTHKQHQASGEVYVTTINPILEVTSQLFGIASVKSLTHAANSYRRAAAERTTVESALVTLDNATGEILAMLGGSNWETSKFNRAVDARIQPGSAIKPLYYSAAISSGKFTPATRIYDGPIVFYNEDGKPYTPSNFLGEWSGSVLLRSALAHSMNVPSLQVLSGIGFDAAIERMSRMLGMEADRDNERVFPHVYPLGLGITPLAPINMAQAYAVFANQGREVDPVAISYIQDRSGNIILEPEKELRAEQKRKGRILQIMSPQAAYVMISLLQSTLESGTLSAVREQFDNFGGMPMAGKTGTTQNWSDAWTVGFSPYYTTAIWFGFDKRGATLGLAQTGATAAGPVWGEYMKAIHKDLPRKEFAVPEAGLVRVKVDAESGLLPSQSSRHVISEVFIAGTEPRRLDTLQAYKNAREEELIRKLQNSALIQSLPGMGAAESGFLLGGEPPSVPENPPQDAAAGQPESLAPEASEIPAPSASAESQLPLENPLLE